MFDGIIPIAIILKIRKQYITLRILQAVATFKSQLQNTIDLIILDINLPGGNNTNMIQSLNSIQEGIKLLMFSAYD